MANVGVPTEEEIARLPRWARVAFAARCARRAQPLFLKAWPDAPTEHSVVIEKAISVAEQQAAYVYCSDAYAADAAVRSGRSTHTARAASAIAYQEAITAVAFAVANSSAAAAFACEHTTNVAFAINNAADAGVPVTSLRSDFDLLLVRSQYEGWTDDTPVPPTVFPPLDAPPVPAAITSEELADDENIRVRIRFFGKPGSTAAELAPHIRETYKALNEYTLAKYGKYLKLADFKRLVVQYAGVPA